MTTLQSPGGGLPPTEEPNASPQPPGAKNEVVIPGVTTQGIFTPPAYDKLCHGIPYEDYARGPGLRSSDLQMLRLSAAHWMAWKIMPQRETPALRFGRLFHRAIENGERFLDTMVIEPVFSGTTKDGKESTRSAAAREKKEQWYAELKPGVTVVTPEEVEQITGMMKSLYTHKLVGKLMKNGVRETSLWTKDPETGLSLQCRPDFISEKGHLCDVKSTRSAHKSFFLSEIFDDRRGPFYTLQAAHYAHQARLSRVCRFDSFYIIAVEKTPPWGVVIYPLDQGCIDVGERHRHPMTKRYAQCAAANTWPGYDERAEPVEIPGWVKYPEYEEEQA